MPTLRIALLTIRLVMRTKVALFFTFLFPLVFLFAYAGLIAHGNPHQLLLQAEAALFIIVWNVVATFVILKVISFIVPLRASEGDVEGGDLAIHGVDPIPFPASG